MRARLADVHDLEEFVAMIRDDVENLRPDLRFNELRTRASFASYMLEASPTIWVAEHNAELVGCLVGDFRPHRAVDGLFTVQELIYVKPENRGSRAAVLLMNAFLDWSRGLGAVEVVGGNDNRFNSERTARFFEHFGFQRVGFAMRLELGNE